MTLDVFVLLDISSAIRDVVCGNLRACRFDDSRNRVVISVKEHIDSGIRAFPGRPLGYDEMSPT